MDLTEFQRQLELRLLEERIDQKFAIARRQMVNLVLVIVGAGVAIAITAAIVLVRLPWRLP
jgi:hypothetical protein